MECDGSIRDGATTNDAFLLRLLIIEELLFLSWCDDPVVPLSRIALRPLLLHEGFVQTEVVADAPRFGDAVIRERV